MIDPFSAIRAELHRVDSDEPDGRTRGDVTRQQRTGVPEIVFAENKTDSMLTEACEQLLSQLSRVIVSRIDPDRLTRIAAMIGESIRSEHTFPGRTGVLVRGVAPPPRSAGRVGILTAGTSDLDVAGEAATVLREIGCHVDIAADVGVAGLHRLVRPLTRMTRDGIDVIIVVAGMDGALPSVVSGLVDVPVIGLPTSVGYGVATGGHAALQTMLSTCAPGMAVVNIDNGVGAAAMAARIAVRARHHQSDS